jgi:hypothetical protein
MYNRAMKRYTLRRVIKNKCTLKNMIYVWHGNVPQIGMKLGAWCIVKIEFWSSLHHYMKNTQNVNVPNIGMGFKARRTMRMNHLNLSRPRMKGVLLVNILRKNVQPATSRTEDCYIKLLSILILVPYFWLELSAKISSIHFIVILWRGMIITSIG